MLFGDLLPKSFDHAIKEAEESDLVLVVGSSLEVSPANQLPGKSKKYIIINREKTYYDRQAQVVWNENAGIAMEKILYEINKQNLNKI